MKRAVLVISCVVALALALTAGLTAGDEEGWLDVENCGMCKHMGAEEGLLQNITWETRIIASGAVTVTTVPGELEEAFKRAENHMKEAAERMQKGEEMHLCGFCQSYGKLVRSGAKIEALKGESARVTLMTSADENVVKMIHEHAQRTIAEYEKWIAEEKAEG